MNQAAPAGARRRPTRPVVPSEANERRRRARSVAIALALGGLAAMFYLVTIAKLGSNVLNRPL